MNWSDFPKSTFYHQERKMMLDPTNEQLKELHKDIMSGSVMTITTEHYKQQAERIKELEDENEQLQLELENRDDYNELQERIKELEIESAINFDTAAKAYTACGNYQERIRVLEGALDELCEELKGKVEALGRFHEKNFDFMEKEERIKELEGAKIVETQVICGLVDCLQRNKKGECGHTSIHFQPCSDCANVAACSEYTE